MLDSAELQLWICLDIRQWCYVLATLNDILALVIDQWINIIQFGGLNIFTLS